jgi:hypothetical protein
MEGSEELTEQSGKQFSSPLSETDTAPLLVTVYLRKQQKTQIFPVAKPFWRIEKTQVKPSVEQGQICLLHLVSS